MKKVLMEGAIPPEKIGKSIANHQVKTHIGAHQIFLGQVRADVIDGKTVEAIEYTAQEQLAEETFHTIREDAFAKYDLSCMHISHSLGRVAAGQICLSVFVSSAHRDQCTEACSYLVERIKKEVPIFGKEIFEDQTHTWKENK